MALDFTGIGAEFYINGKRAANEDVFTGVVNGTKREAVLTLKFTRDNVGFPLEENTKVECIVLDSNGKNVDIGFDSNLEKLTGKFTFNGKYTIKVTIYESNVESSANQKIFTLENITITGCYTTLSSFNPDIIDKNSGVVIKNDMVFSDGEEIIPDLSQELPFDFELDSYNLSRNGLIISYSPYGDRTISDDGDYVLKITIKRRGLAISGDIMVKTFERRFRIEKSFINIITQEDIYIYNAINNTSIVDGYVYVDKDVVLDWDLGVGIEVKSHVLNFYKNAKLRHVYDNNGSITVDANYPPILLGDFEKGSTILSEYGVYKLDMSLVEFNNSKNKLNLTRYFVIERDIIRLDASKLTCYDANNLLTMSTTNNVLTTQEIIPAVSYDEDLEDRIEVDVIVQFNDTQLKPSEFINGETVLDTAGVYQILGRVYETGTPEEERNQYTRRFTFTVVEPPKQMEGLDVTLIHKATAEEVVNGKVYEDIPEGHQFIVNRVKDSEVEVYYEHYSVTDHKTEYPLTHIDPDTPLKLSKPGNYILRLRISDTTINPITGELQYPFNVYEKTYVFSINRTILNEDDPNKLVYINGQLLDAYRLNPIWECLSIDSTEDQFIIVKPGAYNIILANKNVHNFNYSVNEYNVTVVEPRFQQKAIITSDPPANTTVMTSFRVFITFPTTANRQHRQYKDANVNPDVWLNYPEDGIVCTQQCKIYARYKDSSNGDWVETLEADAFTPGPIIDTTPVQINEEDILGVKHGGRYFVASIDVKRKLNHSYTAYIKKPGQDDFEEVPLGSMFKESGTYYYKVSATNDINGNTGESTTIRFVIDHTIPAEPVINLTDAQGLVVADNSRTKSTVTVSLTGPNLDKYYYEGFLNNRLMFRTTKNSNVLNIPKVVRDGAYYLTVIAIDKESGRRAMSHKNFTIVSRDITLSGVPIKPHRYCYEDNQFKFKGNIQPYDGELLLRCNNSKDWNPLGDVGLYRDGIVINKFIELDRDILQLEFATEDIEFDITANRVATDSLSSLKKDLYYHLLRMMVENSALYASVSDMLDYCQSTEVPELDTMVTERFENNSDYKILKNYNSELNSLSSKTMAKYREELQNIIKSLQTNADSIGELYYKANLYNVIIKK